MRIPAFQPALLLAVLVLLWCCPAPARADETDLCRAAIGVVEASQHIPDAFLSAIARVESGRPDQATGTLVAWPWTINAEGSGAFFDTKAQAVAAVRALQARGVRSIDVGCLQVNLMHHPDAFASLEQAFDPAANAGFAASFLIALFNKTGSWPLAAAAYHSQTPNIGAAYQRRVLTEWAVPNLTEAHAPGQQAPARHPGRQTTTLAMQARADPSGAPPPPDIRPAAPALAEATPAFGHMTGAVLHAPTGGGPSFTGRSLAAYRAMPTAFAFRLPRKAG